MYKKLIALTGTRMTPHRFRHTLASDLMRQPERNIHLTKLLLNHSNIATTMEYIEPDYDVMRTVMNERADIQRGRPRRYAKIERTSTLANPATAQLQAFAAQALQGLSTKHSPSPAGATRQGLAEDTSDLSTHATEAALPPLDQGFKLLNLLLQASLASSLGNETVENASRAQETLPVAEVENKSWIATRVSAPRVGR